MLKALTTLLIFQILGEAVVFASGIAFPGPSLRSLAGCVDELNQSERAIGVVTSGDPQGSRKPYVVNHPIQFLLRPQKGAEGGVFAVVIVVGFDEIEDLDAGIGFT